MKVVTEMPQRPFVFKTILFFSDLNLSGGGDIFHCLLVELAAELRGHSQRIAFAGWHALGDG